MSYIFALLVAANATLMGYYLFVDKAENKVDESVAVAKSSLSRPIPFVNSTADVPPEIGERKE